MGEGSILDKETVMNRIGLKGWHGVGLAVWLGVATLAAGAEDEPRLAEYFGFLPLEIYKLDARISNLLLRDLDGDKIDDIVVVNNGRSRIDLLLSGKTPRGRRTADATKPRRTRSPATAGCGW